MLFATGNIKKEGSKSKPSFRITNQIPGWQEVKNTYTKFDAEGLYDIIDGGADLYLEYGLVKGEYQRLEHTNKAQCDIFSEEYSSAQKAKELFLFKKESIAPPIAFPHIKDAFVVGEEIIGGMVLYLCKGRYYFEVTLSGYNSISSLKKVSDDFLNLLISKFD